MMTNATVNYYKVLPASNNKILPFAGLRIGNNDYKFLRELSVKSSLYEKTKFASEKLKNGDLNQDNQSCYYIYKIHGVNLDVVSLIACIPLEYYKNGIINPHEEVLKHKQNEYVNSFVDFKIQISPIQLMHDHDQKIHSLLNTIIFNKKPNNYYLDVKHKLTHYLWKISNSKEIDNITQSYNNINKFYIADGHHRIASLGNIDCYNPNVLSMLSSHKFLNISGIDIGIQNIAYFNKERFFERLKQEFFITEKNVGLKYNIKENECMMLLDNKWYSLKSQNNFFYNFNEPRYVGVNIRNHLLSLTFDNIKTQNHQYNVTYIPHKNLINLQMLANKENFQLIFHASKLTINDVVYFVENKKFVPPKSTYFEPKPIEGFILSLI